ncbi:MAG: HD domain-containing protein [Desulfurococcales archaeon]|nr:HD domain-containing protein [Desulfurococcales archaeon]
MALVSLELVDKHVSRSPLLSKAWKLLQEDVEVQELLRMSNVNAVTRLLYNDHGPVHARIVTGSALEIFDLLLESGIQPSTVMQGVVNTDDQARLIVMLGAYLHDIGNSLHRINHELAGAFIAKDILDRLLPLILENRDGLLYRIRSEVMHSIYATAMDVNALTIEASIVKVADATDMAEGRARIPYMKGKSDIHALSALSIKKVNITPGSVRPVRIEVFMEDYAGIFQIENVLMPKIKTSLIGEYIEVVPRLLRDGSIHLNPIYP